MTIHTPKMAMLLCAGFLAGCQAASVSPTTFEAATLPTLTGEANAVARLIPAMAQKGLQMQPVPASRADALTRYCGGGADVLALSSDMTDAEVTACADAGGQWSAVASEGFNLYLAPPFNALHSGFDWWG